MDETPVFKYNAMDVEAVAQAGYRGLRKRKRLVVPGVINNVLSGAVRVTPRSTILDVMTLLQPVQK
jgi:short-subunit dehydrogenase